MQRRAAAVYFALFVVVGAGAYGLLGVMSAPTIALDGPSYAQGDQLSAGGVTYTVDSVGESSVTLTFQNETSGEEETREIQQGSNVTLGGTQHFAHIPAGGGAQILPTDQYYDEYRHELAVEDKYHERRAGVWAIVFMSFLAAIVLLTTAYLPTRG